MPARPALGALSLVAAVAAACLGPVPAAGVTPLAPWSQAQPPNALRLEIGAYRRPRGGFAEAIAVLVLADGTRRELGRFIPSEGGAARNVAVRLVLDPGAQTLLATARGSAVQVGLAGRGGELTVRRAILERVE
jgi:hypothetical protein